MASFLSKLFRSRTQKRLNYLTERLNRLEKSLANIVTTTADVVEQNRQLRETYPRDTEKLILFMLPGVDIVSGGIVSICSLCDESRQLETLHGAAVFAVTIPVMGFLTRYTQFENNTPLFQWHAIREHFTGLKSIMIHIPECHIAQFLAGLTECDRRWLASLNTVHMNILNQNNELMPSAAVIQSLRQLSTQITCTTAHPQTARRDIAEKLNMPVHFFGAFVAPQFYDFKNYSQKQNILIVSPDPHPMKTKILGLLRKKRPDIQQIEIRNMHKNEYLRWISLAKWSISFGEGFDGYYIEPVYSGSVPLTVYNTEFFTPDFKDLETVYPSYEYLYKNILSELQRLDHENIFTQVNRQAFEVCEKYYSYTNYRENLRRFYQDQYDFDVNLVQT